MQISNNTDETIVLRPNECISGDTTTRSFNKNDFRIEVNRVNEGPDEVSEFTTPVERHINRFDEDS